jgi:hypothetical protein
MRNVEKQIVFLVVLLGTSAAGQDTRAEELVNSVVQTAPNAGATGPATPVASDAATGQLPGLQASDSQRLSVDGGLADFGNGAAYSDASSNAEVLRDPAKQPKDILYAERRVVLPEPAAQSVPGSPLSRESEYVQAVAAKAVNGPSSRLPLLGLMADLGVPDGLIGSLVVRPWNWVRISGGGGTNSISHGWRTGITLLPFGAGPSASLEYGRYQDGDANALAKRFMGSGFSGSPALERVGYEYMNAHLGLDFGSRKVVFFIHGGVTMLRGQIHNLDAATRAAGTSGMTEVIVRSDPTFKAVGPSFKLGLLVYVW